VTAAIRTATIRASTHVLAADERASAKALWRRLERQVAQPGLTCSWDWTEVWLDHFGDVVPHEFVVVSEGGEPVGAALLTRGVGRKRNRVAVRTLHVGTAGEPRGDSVFVENNRLLVVPERREAAVRAIVAAVHEDETWDEFWLDGFVPEDASQFLGADASLVARREPCPTVDLRAADERDGDVLSILTPNTRYQIRRSIRAFGDVAGEWAESVEEALDILDELIRLHQRRWRDVGQPGAFASERFTAFHRSLVKLLLPEGAILLYRVRSRRDTIGCLYSLLERNDVLSYQLGLHRFQDNKLKPGFVAHALCMQASYERGFADYNFLADATPWKRELATTERHLIWASASRRRLKLAVADALGAGVKLVRRGR
jgi:CelD/BcsL family acetyltransferase involved in cellulose biosynthesis